jgi:predicted ester cyclase
VTQPRSIAEVNAAVAELGLNTQIQPNLREYTPNQGMISGISPNGREFNFTVNVNTGIGDPNAIAEAVTQVIQEAVDRGTLRGTTDLFAI